MIEKCGTRDKEQTSCDRSAEVQNAIVVTITTSGDRLKDHPLFEIGGKGLFAKELEQALQANKIDFAVHSLKDMESISNQYKIIFNVRKKKGEEDKLKTKYDLQKILAKVYRNL